MKKSSFKAQGGFTFIELILVIGIIAVIATISFLNLYDFRSKGDLDLSVREIVSMLRNAHDRSMSQEDGAQWGIHLENQSNGDNFYFLYEGATTTLISKKILSSNLQFIEPGSDANKNILFSFNGWPIINGVPNSSTTVMIAFKNDSFKVGTIFINSNGQIKSSFNF
ncbi:MAG: hypothetical protein UR88_C0004G0003 [Candidatus Nomurabacteria bacterium GW2011_GWA1_35_8]|uniref:Prepilin-type N-terminal cleavage/methylation domain-containing protein n=1 Tax=Candidatus Nomurabacteria bacterium GW2011_GWA1_35_8 TaxID=1618727 RepID=A0A0G0DBA3_9BACT|nr:MAG: hypothetical protein UR88_C0004G0003 [Candidatus Nomurabacteria bacterium GW2011_GWA1_35_8]